MRGGSIFAQIRAAGLVLALAALSFKAMLPPGFMLDVGRTNEIAITLCGGVDGFFDLETGKIRHGDKPEQTRTESPCPFALASVTTLVEPGAAERQRLTASVPIAVATYRAVYARSYAGPPLPARGPPLLV